MNSNHLNSSRLNSSRLGSSKKSGFTLHELVWAFTLSTMVMAIAITWIHQTTKFSRRMTQNKHNHAAMSRLAWDLRHEVRNSNSISLDDKQRLHLTWDSGATATFKIDGTSVLFEKQISDKQTKRENYQFSRDVKVIWDSDEMPDTIGLLIERTLSLKKPVEGVKELTTDDQANPLPVDLIVRVSPNRWAVTDDSESGSQKTRSQDRGSNETDSNATGSQKSALSGAQSLPVEDDQ